VERDHGPPAEGVASFHTTHRTIVVKAAQSQAQVGQSALAKLCRVYWYPFYIFARRRGHSPDGVKDLTQGFFLHLLDHRALTGVDRLKGKFHPFLIAFFRNHPSDQVDRTRGLGAQDIEERCDLRKRYTALLRGEVGRTGSDPAEIDEQIHALSQALIASEEHLGP
jgi:DNA-directed RNA polymerase specialized sigma24 family protein